ALVPAAIALLVALAPGPSGGESTIAGAPAAHVHAHAPGAAAFRPGFGGHAGHYVYPNAVAPRLPSWSLALIVAAAALLTYAAAGALHRRAPDVAQGGARRVADAPATRALATLALVLAALGACAPKASAHA